MQKTKDVDGPLLFIRRKSNKFLLLLFILLSVFSSTQLRAATVNIHAIQTNLPESPYLGQTITTTGIVIAILSDGFYIENSSMDSDVCTAEGIFVYTPSGVPSTVAMQESVTVTGPVEASNSSGYAGTQIRIASPDSTNVVVNSTGNTLPTTISAETLTSATNGTCSLYSAGTFGQWLPFEGMRVNVPSSSSLLVAQGTGGDVDASTQTATTNGQFWAVLTSDSSASARPFRSTGISKLENVPTEAPSTVQRWEGNPQLLLVDSKALGGTAINATAGTRYTGGSNLVGIIDYHVSAKGYTGLLLTSDSVSSLSAGNSVSATKATLSTAAGQITIATQDLNNLTEIETKRITKLANAIANYEHSPDILAVQGSTTAALTLLESAISSAGGASYVDSGAYSTADSSGLVNAFLVNSAKFENLTITPALASTVYTTASGSSATLFDRNPLVLTAEVPRTGTTNYPIVVVNSSLLSRDNIDSTASGAEVRLKREQQAEQLVTQLIAPYQNSGDHLFVVGGFNSFEFSDGFVDSLGILDGLEAQNTTKSSTGDLVTLYDATYNSVGLTNTTTAAINLSTGATNASTNRYTYIESGSSQQPDHILVAPDLSSLVSLDYARFGADFPVKDTYDTSTVNRASTHDGVIAYVTIPYPTSTVLKSSLNPSYLGQTVTFTATVSSAVGTPAGTVSFYDSTTLLGSGTLSSGSATFSTSSLSVGTHPITAIYGGEASHYASTSNTVSQVVLPLLASATTLNCSPNPATYGTSVTCTASVSGSSTTPTGTVVFYDSTTALGTVTLSSGVATYTTSSLAVGAHPISAVYSGNTPYSTSTSNTVNEVITSDFSISVTPTSASVYTGEAASFQVTVTPQTGFTSTVSFECSNLPSNTTCTFSPSSVSNGSGTSTWTIQTTAPSRTTAGNHTPHLPWQIPAGTVALGGVFLMVLPQRFRRGGAFLALIAIVALNGMLGCSSPRSLTGGTTPGTYTITVTASSNGSEGAMSHSSNVTLTVKSLFQ